MSDQSFYVITTSFQQVIYYLLNCSIGSKSVLLRIILFVVLNLINSLSCTIEALLNVK